MTGASSALYDETSATAPSQAYGERTGIGDRPAKGREEEDDDTNGRSGNPRGIGGDDSEDEQEDEVGEDDDDEEDDEVEDDEEDEEEEDEEEEDEEEEDDEEEDEPRLKYARLTQQLGAVYRNGDATSSFLVAGDKMIIGTHNGNIHVIQLPSLESLRVYHAHSASVTGISISPCPPPIANVTPEGVQRLASQASASSLRPETRHPESSPAAASRRSREPPPVPNTPSNNIHIATSSMDGHVCVQNLTDMRDVQLRNFARPVQAVALSPEFRTDRTYLSGGLANQLILTVGAPSGRSTSTTVGTAAATASGWLGSIGLGTHTGKETVLHSGEGVISSIKWSASGKYVVWLNEHGLKIMRTHLHLDSSAAGDAWQRIGHVDRPQTDEWDAMASVWKGRAEWIDEDAVDADEETADRRVASAPPAERPKRANSGDHHVERLIVGWGGNIWIIHVHPAGIGVGRNAGERSIGHAVIAKHLRMDCIISGISLYSQKLLLVLAYPQADEAEDSDEEAKDGTSSAGRGHKSRLSTASASSEPAGGIRKRQNNQPPELRIIDLASQSEVDKDDGLIVSRYERLSSGDYHLGVLPGKQVAAVASAKGALESLAGFGSEMWNAAINPRALFSSNASVRSKNSGDEGSSGRGPSTTGSLRLGSSRPRGAVVHPHLVQPGSKIFIHSPYDCILATKRDLGDHLTWLLEHQRYQEAWELLDEHPEIMSAPPDKLSELVPPTPDRKGGSGDDLFYDDASSVAESVGQGRNLHSTAQKEKRRIGELWIRGLIEDSNWTKAGQVCGKVLGTSDRWEKWVWTFAGANKFDEIVNVIPTETMHPPLSRAMYEVVLNHYIQADKLRFWDLLDRWPSELFDIGTVTTALENQVKYRDVREDSVEDGERGRDWRIVMRSLARLHEANGRYRESLKCYIRLQDADSAFRLIRSNHLADAVADDIPSFIGLRVPADKLSIMGEKDIEQATSEAITLLVDEAQHGLVSPSTVVLQLQAKDLKLFLYFYLRALYRGEGIEQRTGETRERMQMESQTLVDDFADLAVQIFAQYDQPLLMDFLRSSTSYTFEKAAQECERYRYNDELVYLYSKTGQMKKALFLIIDRLQDVKKAIDFAKEQDDEDLWEDLITYSMDKPSFIRGLLEQVGTAIDPITLVRRIPEGLEIEGLRDGLKHIMKEHEIQFSISSGVARVLRSEVSSAQSQLRRGQRRGVKFEVMTQSRQVDGDEKEGQESPEHVEQPTGQDIGLTDKPLGGSRGAKPGHCAVCNDAFTEFETETLVGFACGHIYHLTHLMESLYPQKKQDVDHGAGAIDRPGHGWRVGPKVTHARLLRDKILDGCPECISAGKRTGEAA